MASPVIPPPPDAPGVIPPPPDAPGKTAEPRVLRAPLPEGTAANIPGAVRETLGIEYRPGARTVGHTVYQPKGVPEHLAQAAITAPLTAFGGEAAYFAPWLGRSLMSGVIGAAQAASRGDSVAWSALLDAAVAAGTEGLSALIPKVHLPYRGSLETMKKGLDEATEKVANMKKAYEWATKAPQEALAALQSRLPKGKWMNVPTLSKTKLSAQEAIDGLVGQGGKGGLEGYDYQQARGEIISEFNRLDIQSGVRGTRGPRPYAGQAFNLRTSPERFTPAGGFAPPTGTRGERIAEGAIAATQSPAARTAADVAMTEEPAPGLPVGAVLGNQALTSFGDVARSARHLMMP